MLLQKAIALYLDDWKLPVITDYHLGLFVFRMHQEKIYRGRPITINKSVPEISDFRLLLKKCLSDGILNINKDFSGRVVFNILGASNSPAEDIACTVNPFAYMSHLSAMDYHGLTDRNPLTLYISSPSPSQWKHFAAERMKKDLRENFFDYRETGFPLLKKILLKKVNKRPIHCFSSLHLGSYRNIKDRPLRVATIGKTFLDMLRDPNLCGGVEHVLDVYQEHAQDYLDLIVEEIHQHGKPIDKIRAGYILNELLGVSHPLITQWETFIQRGGSRKLDASGDYAPVYSKKWRLSINTIKERTKRANN
ncbi:MAG: hypothetical protein JXR73_08905 [Candidatus Omnitrophica bacterium]|nr:hypothetical protein [Candidatus Omnitrophota bacterium]